MAENSPPANLPARVAEIRAGLARRIVGMDGVVEQTLWCLATGGHGLLVGVPGLAKTLLCSSLAQLLDLKFKRIQFTPDLMPGDVTGSETLSEIEGGGRGFRFVPGPVFANLLLADEINRTPPKTQAALMEAMEERQVTVGGVARPLDPPFLVLATQNPIEQEGTYELPAAQLDRFLVRIEVGYPGAEDERTIVRRTVVGRPPDLSPVLRKEDVLSLQRALLAMPAESRVARYATALARASRPGAELPKSLDGLLQWGAGPRAAQALVLAAKARALLAGRREPTADDVRAAAGPVLRHRVVPSYLAVAENVAADEIVRRVVASVPAPDGWTPPAAVARKRGFLDRLRARA